MLTDNHKLLEVGFLIICFMVIQPEYKTKPVGGVFYSHHTHRARISTIIN